MTLRSPFRSSMTTRRTDHSSGPEVISRLRTCFATSSARGRAASVIPSARLGIDRS